MADPYIYPGTKTLINIEGIRDRITLEKFERRAVAIRLETLPLDIPLTAAGYRQIHLHIFQDVYDWAGRDRLIDISRTNSLFCRALYIKAELDKRFRAIQAEKGLQDLDRDQFASRAAEHLSELNAIHPFRDGNGRTLRAFLEILALQARHAIDMARIDARAWNEASRESFRTGDSDLMRAVIAGTFTGPDGGSPRQD